MPEPPDGHALYWRAAGTGEYPVVAIRDDRLATEWEWTDTREARWFEANSGSEPMTYDELCEHSAGEGYPMSEARVLGPMPEVVGGHVREPGGYCRTCGDEHAPTEWARIAARASEGGSGG